MKWLLTLTACFASGANAPPSWFREEAAARGLLFRHFHGGTGEFYLPESLGSGVALFDFDRDGDLDVYLLQGAALHPRKAGWRPPGASASNRLFRNQFRETGSLRFVDVTRDSGAAALTGYSLGVAAGDYDGDGWTDLLVTGVRGTTLLRNGGNGRFEDRTGAAGVAVDGVTTGAAFFDYDSDGRPDLLILRYVDFAVAGNRQCPDSASGKLDYCLPALYRPLPAKIFRNEGGGRFRDVSAATGISTAAGAGLGIAIADFDNDGWLDAYVANDGTPNHLWMNRGGTRFEETGLEAAVAYDDQGRAQAGMGVSVGDFDNDGDEDLVVANLMGETLALYENDGHAEFRHVTARAGLAAPSAPYTGFGIHWADFDHDGWLDLLVANGSVKRLPQNSPYPYGQRNQVFRNQGGRFTEWRERAFQLEEASRGLALGDLDLDGDLDAVITNSEGPPRLLLNQTAAPGLMVELEPAVEGTRVGLESADGRVTWRRSTTAGSYLSASDPAVHFARGAGPAWIRVGRQRVAVPPGVRRPRVKLESKE